jgi:glycosyltransferase involved in cell wall biosynthesis
MISVCIATYNGEKYIQQQLLSILCQIGEKDEIIVSDDCSTDATLTIVKALQDKRIIVLENTKKFKSYNYNFENALKKASGDIIFLADQDDVWDKDRVENIIQYFKTYNLVICNCFYTDKDLNLLKGSWFESVNAGNGFVKNFIKNTYVGCCMAFNRKVLNAALPFPDNIDSHDTWIGLMAEMTGNPFFLDKQLHYFRRHGENFSVNSGIDSVFLQKSPYSLQEKLIRRFYLAKNIYNRYKRLKNE